MPRGAGGELHVDDVVGVVHVGERYVSEANILGIRGRERRHVDDRDADRCDALGECRSGDESHGARLGENPARIIVAQLRVEWHGGRAEACESEPGECSLGSVVQEHRNAIAGADAPCPQVPGDAIGCLGDLGEGERRRRSGLGPVTQVEDPGGAVRPQFCGAAYRLGKGAGVVIHRRQYLSGQTTSRLGTLRLTR